MGEQRLVIGAWLCVLVLAVSQAATPQDGAELKVLTGAEASAAVGALSGSLTKIGLDLIQHRGQASIATITGAEAVRNRQAYVRERILREIGGLPERTPLNPRTVSVLHRDGYDIEKIIFESQPNLFVTANLYLPSQGKPPYPAILVPLGHEAGAKAHDAWQRLLITFARNGFVALTYDPIGQGERVQLYDPDLRGSKAGESTKEHTIIGIQCLLTGDNLARYTIWDAMRALDYLQSRKEVDPKRIGCTGNSGGGTMTAYLSALDNRISAAAPSCFITSWRQLLQTIGPQDAEQCMPPFLLDGLDQPDFVEAFAPKPYLILSAIRDFFPIDGARQSFREARQIYGLLNTPEKLDMVEVDDGHGYSAPRRLAAYRWMNRWLAGSDKGIVEREMIPESEETLWCTPTGQVSVSLGGETVFSINQKRGNQLVAGRKWPSHPDEVSAFIESRRKAALRLSACRITSDPVPTVKHGELRREGYRIERLAFESEPGIPVPSLIFIPDGAHDRMPAVLFLNGWGKTVDAGVGGEIESLVRAGNVVMASDLRGIGETAEPEDGWSSAFFRGYDSAMKALLVGKPLAGLRVEDILAALNVLSVRPEVDPARIAGYGKGSAAIPLLHAAAFDDRFRSVVFSDMLVSYESAVNARIHRNIFENVIQGMLESYDLPDLLACLGPRRVTVVDPVDPLGNRIAPPEAAKAYAHTRGVFRLIGAESSFQVIERRAGQPILVR